MTSPIDSIYVYQNENKYLNLAEWIFIFHGESSMTDSWFVIKSGYEDGQTPTKVYLIFFALSSQ